MVDLSKTFVHCLHCGQYTAEPRNVCPRCDWPRCHSDETPQPDYSCTDPNAQFVTAQMPVIQQHVADVKIVPPAAQPAAMVEASIPDLGVIVPTPPVKASSMKKLRTLTLAPEDPVPEADPE